MSGLFQLFSCFWKRAEFPSLFMRAQWSRAFAEDAGTALADSYLSTKSGRHLPADASAKSAYQESKMKIKTNIRAGITIGPGGVIANTPNRFPHPVVGRCVGV
jgi:hypothetical protein